MPIYEFRCTRCGAILEVLLPAGQVPAKCPKCGATELERKVSTFSPGRSQARSCTPRRG